MKRVFFILAAVVAVIVAWAGVRRLIPSYIEYRGEKIKLTKYYLTYESYKDDPDNLHPSEIVRVQRLVAEAPFPRFFYSRQEMIDAGFRIHFPGYGVGGLSDGTSGGENSLSGVAVEIPQADKDRYFVFRQRNGTLVMVDTFVASNVPQIMRVKQNGNSLVYSTFEGEVKLTRQLQSSDN